MKRRNSWELWGHLVLAALCAVIFLGTLHSARASSLPRSFLEVFLESRAGAQLMERLPAVPRGVNPVSHLSQHLELSQELRPIRALLAQKAQAYGEVLHFERTQGSFASMSYREIESALKTGVPSLQRLSPEARRGFATRVYRNLSNSERDILLQLMEMGPHYGIEGLTEFLPSMVRVNLVGMPVRGN